MFILKVCLLSSAYCICRVDSLFSVCWFMMYPSQHMLFSLSNLSYRINDWFRFIDCMHYLELTTERGYCIVLNFNFHLSFIILHGKSSVFFHCILNLPPEDSILLFSHSLYTHSRTTETKHSNKLHYKTIPPKFKTI